MAKHIFAIGFIFVCATAAWLVLGTTIFSRTQRSDRQLAGRVSSTWGTSHTQEAPVAYIEKLETRVIEGADPRAPDDRRRATATPPPTETIRTKVPLRLEQTRASVVFDLNHRQKGLLWYSTYEVAFEGAFRFRNTTRSDSVLFEFGLPASHAMYDDLRVTLNGAPAAYETRDGSIVTNARVAPGGNAALAVAYRSQGLGEWRYVLGKDVAEARDFELMMRTNFNDIDFPDNTLSPTGKRKQGDGWELQWKYTNLLSGFQIGMDMPQKLQPGPVAGEIAFFAPVSLLFFFAAMFLIVTIRRIDLHPMNYAFLAAAFFSFHLLLAYLVDHISIHVAFLISSVVSLFLVVSYLRLVVGPRFAYREAAVAQFVYLVLFSYAFFFKGLTGLTITIGSILTLFVAMQLTGRIRWSEVFAADATGLPRKQGSLREAER